MKNLDEFSELIVYAGDKLFSFVFEAVHSRQKATGIIIKASEKYLESRKSLKI